MSFIESAWRLVPSPLRVTLQWIRARIVGKQAVELSYWRKCHKVEGGFNNDWYRESMLDLSGEPDETFLHGKVVADFGCGPLGSLAWASNATLIGIDVLASAYAEAFPDDIRSHGMIYVTSTEKVIPIPDNLIDILFTMNALDHVADLKAMCNELCRILKPGGRLLASFNLNEEYTAAEPHTLTEESLQKMLLGRFERQSMRFGKPGGGSPYVKGAPGYMLFDGILLA